MKIISLISIYKIFKIIKAVKLKLINLGKYINLNINNYLYMFINCIQKTGQPLSTLVLVWGAIMQIQQ